ncbi:MAG: DsbC family protein [Burkholderiales bacterium]|nr:DsbC family protein [Burkholderiales bacterium]
MKKTLFLFLFVLGLQCFAVTLSTSDLIKSSLKHTLPKVNVTAINDTPIPNIYQVISDKKIFYVDSSGKYLFIGNLIDLSTKANLTQLAVQSISVVDWNQLPLKIAIRHVNGDGKRKIAVFTDPDCPFCKQLDQETVPKLKNVTIYYYLYPLAIHARAESDAKKILCSETLETTFLSWMKDNKALPLKTVCNNANNLKQMITIGKLVGVEATPTIVLPDGNIITGLVPADYLNQLITNAVSNDKKPLEGSISDASNIKVESIDK